MTAPPGQGNHLAVQQDACAVAVDWQGFTPDHSAGRFHGGVFVLDAAGQYATHVEWAEPTDADADRALIRGGWRRVDAWRSDVYGRRVAAVHQVPATTVGPPARTSSSSGLVGRHLSAVLTGEP